MESRDVLKIHGALRRYCTSCVLLRSTLEVQYLLKLPCIFNTSLDSMLYLLIILLDILKIDHLVLLFLKSCSFNISLIYSGHLASYSQPIVWCLLLWMLNLSRRPYKTNLVQHLVKTWRFEEHCLCRSIDLG